MVFKEWDEQSIKIVTQFRHALTTLGKFFNILRRDAEFIKWSNAFSDRKFRPAFTTADKKDKNEGSEVKRVPVCGFDVDNLEIHPERAGLWSKL